MFDMCASGSTLFTLHLGWNQKVQFVWTFIFQIKVPSVFFTNNNYYFKTDNNQTALE